MKRVITGFNVVNAPQGQRLGFTFVEMDEEGNTIKDNSKGSMIVLDEECQGHIDAVKKYINGWIEKQLTKQE